MKYTLHFFRPSIQISLALASAAFGVAGVARADTVIGSGHVISETRTVSGFHGVTLSGSGDVAVTQGDTEGLVIDAEDNILPLIESTVQDGILHLGFKPHTGSVSFKKPVIFHLAVKTLDKMLIEGSGDIHAASLSTDKLNVEVPGSGDVSVDHLKADAVKVDVKGSGDVKFAGEGKTQKISLDGSGDYEAKDFKTDDTTLQINGSGDSQVWANTSLSVEINGSGDVGYVGTPKLKKSVNGSGGVHALTAKNE